MISLACISLGIMTAMYYPIMMIKDGVESELDMVKWLMGKELHFIIKMRACVIMGFTLAALGVFTSLT